MAIAPGTRLSHFEIANLLGAGGMGEVYKARDTRLDRIVAIKVLPAHLADQPELRERFEREARTIASLNHAHICTLHDIGRQDDTDFLVMEYLEGETLATRLLKGPLPLEQVLQYAIEISDALDKAHRKGVTHRDIKPGNVMLTKSGTKLLDFGLAKLKHEAAPANASMSQLPTLSHNPTAEGTILGTLQYMAPEQVEGKNDQIDARTDIFAFGALMYEMATGKKAFEGRTQASLIAKILETDPPPISSLQPMTPTTLDHVVQRCLAKGSDERWQSAGDIAHELKWIAEGGSQGATLPAAPAKGMSALSRPALFLSLSTLLLGAVIAGIAAWALKPTPPVTHPVSRFEYDLPQSQVFRNTGRAVMALSPDGSHFVYNTTQGLYLRSMDQLEARLIPGTEAVLANPFFSPDGQWVAYWQDGQLKKIAITGGVAVTICPATNLYGASWASDNTILFAQPEGIQRVSVNGRTPELIIKSEEGEQFDGPQLLPGGEWVMFAVRKGAGSWDDAHLVVQSLKTKERRGVWQGGSDARYVPTGHIVYALGDNLFAIPFDLATLSVKGSPVPAAEGVLRAGDGTTASANYGISDGAGSLVYIAGGGVAQAVSISWMDRQGNFTPLLKTPRRYYDLVFSPDGKRLAMDIGDGAKTDIWVYELERDILTRLTFSGANSWPFWTPDGQRIVYSSQDKDGPPNLWWIRADGSGEPQRLARSDSAQSWASWRPDGKVLAFDQTNPETNDDVMTLSMEGDEKSGWKLGQPTPFVNSRSFEGEPAFSPDGRWLAHPSNESGRFEVYVRPFPGPGGKWQISNGGGVNPEWSRDGNELFYKTLDGKIMVVTYSTSGDSFHADAPRPWSPGKLTSNRDSYNFTLHPDGKRFAVFTAPEEDTSATTHVNIVQNWFEELKQRVPSGNK